MGSTSNTLKRTLYDNCIAHDLAGDIIFYCSKKRCKWYLDRNLAIKLNDDPLEIQLTFQTKGKGNFSDDFYQQVRENICVVCGSKNDLQRHHVIPKCFRDHMPEKIKNHSYHDILLLCKEHHEKYEVYALELKKKLADAYGIPIDIIHNPNSWSNIDGVWVSSKTNHIDRHKSISIARALIKHADKIPNERKEYLINKIKEILNIDVVNLKVVADMKFNDGVVVEPMGKIVVGRLTSPNKFLYLWRKHFVDCLAPKFMPKNWDLHRSTR